MATNNRQTVEPPEGVSIGQYAAARINGGVLMPTDKIRELSNTEHELLRHPNFEGQGFNGYSEPVSMGEKAWDVLARTDMKSYAECAAVAVRLALAKNVLARDPKWKDAPFVGMPMMQAAYWIEMALRNSISRVSRKEALMGQVGFLAAPSQIWPGTNPLPQPRPQKNNWE